MALETFYSLRKFVPEGMRDQMVIAGGYAACPELADDIDIWVLADDEFAGLTEECDRQEYLGTRRFHLKAHLSALGTERVSASEHDYAGDHKLVTTVTGLNNFSGYNKSLRLLDKKIQLLVVPHRTPQELVDSFDISTHAIALQRSRFTFGRGWTRLNQTPNVLRWNQPGKSLERLLKISKRYGLTPRPQDVAALTELAQAESVVGGLAEQAA
jgi:hypothetical protein